jgi:hypothetical protein
VTTRIVPPGSGLQHAHEQFDPVVEGARYGLPRDLSLAIWERSRAEATDRAGRCDVVRARRRFHEIAADLTPRSSGVRSDVGRLTRVGVELESAATPRVRNSLALRVPGRETLVAAESRRWSTMPAERAIAGATVKSESGEAVGASPGAGEVMATTPSQQHPAELAPTRPPVSVPKPRRRTSGVDMRAWHPPGYEQGPQRGSADAGTGRANRPGERCRHQR